MAFDRSRLQCVANHGGNGPRLWTYKTTDALGTVDGAGYFNDAGDILKLGDIIFVLVVTNIDASNEAFSAAGITVVNARSGPAAGAFTVDVANHVALATVDSD
jgi:hypothetical protein